MPVARLPRLGKKPPRRDARTLQFRTFLRTEELPALPRAHDQATHVRRWRTLGNRRIEDCTCAAAGHLIHAWTARVGSAVILPTRTIEHAYSQITGYDPRTGRPDDGSDVLSVLKYWRKSGIGGHHIEAFVELQRRNRSLIRAAIYLLGGVYVGFGLPRSVHGQPVWRVPTSGTRGRGRRNSWGGHVVSIIGYDERGLTAITWGRRQRMTWGFWEAYCDEAYAVLGRDLFDGQMRTPAGLDLAGLRAALAALR